MLATARSPRMRHALFVLACSPFVIQAASSVALAQTPPACGTVTDQLPRVPANYGSFTPPPKGQSYVDQAFGCTIRRLTDAATEYPGEGVAMGHQYASVNPFNMDSTRVLVGKSNGIMQVRDLNGNVIRDNLHTVGILPGGSPVWSRTDPNLLYFMTTQSPPCIPYCRQVLLKSFNVSTGSVTQLHDFSLPQYPYFDQVAVGWGEGDISWDGTRLPMIACSGAQYCHPATPAHLAWVFIHLIGGSSTEPVMVTGQFVDNSDMLPSTNGMVVQRVYPANQIDLYGPDGRLQTERVLDYHSHWDRGKDTDGTDMFVLGNGGDTTPDPACPFTPDGSWKIKFRLPSGPEQCHVLLHWKFSDHVSCNNVGQDWCLVSTYPNDATIDPSDTWPVYAKELFMLKLDASPTIRLAHSRSGGFGSAGYDRTPRAAVSPNGQYILFDSDMADNCGNGSECPKTDVYLLILPGAP